MATKKPVKKKPAAKTKPAKKTVKKATKPVKKSAARPAKKPAKPVKKVVKPVKKGAKPIKATKAKPVTKAKPKALPKKKVVAKAKPKTTPKKTNTIKKKPVAKKAAPKKPVKKAVAKKPVKKVKVVAKPVKKVVKPVPKKTAPAKKSAPAKPAKAVKPAKPVKPVAKKPVPVKPERTKKAATKAKEPVKPLKKQVEPANNGKTQKKLASEVVKVKEKAGRRKKKKSGGDDDDGPKMDEFDPIVEELMSVSKKKNKQPKAPKVPSPIKLIPTVRIEAVEKEHVIPKNFRNGGKEQFEMEFFIKSSPRILYNFISSPSGLSEWFSDDVNIKNGIYTFFWEDSEEQAKLLATREFELMRFKWVNTDDDDTYFEMRIKIDELTGDVALIITDFARKEELDQAQRLWDAQIQNLCKAIGS